MTTNGNNNIAPNIHINFVGIASSYSPECMFMCRKPVGDTQLQHSATQFHATSDRLYARTRIRRDIDGIRAAERHRSQLQPGHCL